MIWEKVDEHTIKSGCYRIKKSSRQPGNNQYHIYWNDRFIAVTGGESADEAKDFCERFENHKRNVMA